MAWRDLVDQSFQVHYAQDHLLAAKHAIELLDGALDLMQDASSLPSYRANIRQVLHHIHALEASFAGLNKATNFTCAVPDSSQMSWHFVQNITILVSADRKADDFFERRRLP
jgi:hypothetical protein